MIDAIARDYAQQACFREPNALGAAFFEEHLSVVASFSGHLAKALQADSEVVLVASYLHDISAVHDIGTLPDHASLSAQQAHAWVMEHGGDTGLADAVSHCVASHSQPLASGSPEAICLSNADALAQLARPAYWLWFAFGLRKLGFAEGREWLRGLYVRNWRALSPAAQALGEEAYARAMNLLATAGEG